MASTIFALQCSKPDRRTQFFSVCRSGYLKIPRLVRLSLAMIECTIGTAVPEDGARVDG
jgi:hypothetical protein